MKCKIKRLDILVQQICKHINILESEIKYIKTLKKVQEDQVYFIQGIYKLK